MPFGGLLTGGIISGAGSLLGGLFGANSASKAAAAQRAAAIQAQGVNDKNTQMAKDTALSNGYSNVSDIFNNTQQANGTVGANTATANNAATTNAGIGNGLYAANQGAATGAYQPYSTLGATAAGQLNTAASNPFSFNLADDPGYQFRLNEGNKAINNAAAAKGLSGGGGTLKALTQYGQNYASNEYGNAFNRNQQQLATLLGQAGLGFQGAQGQVGAGNFSTAGQNTNLGNLSSLLSGNLNTNSSLQSNNLNNNSAQLTNARDAQSQLVAQILGQNSALASQNYTGAGNATAAGIIGKGNAISSAIGGVGNSINSGIILNKILGNTGAGNTAIGNANLDSYNSAAGLTPTTQDSSGLGYQGLY